MRKKPGAQAPEVLPPATTPIEGSSDLLVGLAQSGDPATLLAAVRGLGGGAVGVLDGAPAETSPPATAGTTGESVGEPAIEPEETSVTETPVTAPPVLPAPEETSSGPAAEPVTAPQGEGQTAPSGWPSPDVEALTARALATVHAVVMGTPSQETVSAPTLITPPAPAPAPTLTPQRQNLMLTLDFGLGNKSIPGTLDDAAKQAVTTIATESKKALDDEKAKYKLASWQGAVALTLAAVGGAVVGTYILAPAMNRSEVDVNVTPMRSVGGSK